MGGGGAVRPPPPLDIWFLLKISLGNPYQKILDLPKLFAVDAPIKKKIKKIVILPRRALWNMGLKTGLED